MNTRILRPLGFFLFASLFLGVGTTFADEAAIKAGMKGRLPKVLALKDAGTVDTCHHSLGVRVDLRQS